MAKDNATLDKMKHATFKAFKEDRLNIDDVVEFCNFALAFCNAESLKSASKRYGVSVQAITKRKEVKIIAGKKFFCEND